MSRILDVRGEADRVVVVLRPYRAWEAIAFPLGMLAALLILAAVMPERYSQQERVVFGLIWLGAGLALGSVAFLVAYLLAGGEETVTASGTQVLIDRQILRLPEVRRRRAYAADRIANLRAVGPQKPPRPWAAILAFDHGGSTVQFGMGVAGADADRVLQALAAVLPPTAGEPARTAAAGAIDARARAWSRVTLSVAVLSVACLVQVIVAWPPNPADTTLALAVAIVGSGFIPMWAFVIWMLESPLLWRCRVWLRLVAILGCFMPALFASAYVATWVSRELLDPLSSVEPQVAKAIWVGNMSLVLVGVVWATYRADKRGWKMREVRGVSRTVSGR